MKGNAVSRIALFSSIIFNTCLLKESSVSSGSMDRYLKKSRDNFEHEFTKLGPAVCVLGKSGIGKSWTVHNVLDPCIELTAEILSSKQSTLSFLERIRGTDIPVVLDEYESVQDLVGIREITEPPTNGLFVVVSQVPVKLNFDIETYHFPVPGEDTIRRIAPGVSDEVLKKCRGDLRYAIQSLSFESDEKDEFQGARDFIESLVLKNSDVNPLDFAGHAIHEPGNVTAILHENYPDSKTCHPEEVMESLSESMIFESKIYAGSWDLYPYYNFFGVCASRGTDWTPTHEPSSPGVRVDQTPKCVRTRKTPRDSFAPRRWKTFINGRDSVVTHVCGKGGRGCSQGVHARTPRLGRTEPFESVS